MRSDDIEKLNSQTLRQVLSSNNVVGDDELLYPMKTWKDKSAFDETARKLVGMFQKNFAKYEKDVDPEVRAAAPEVRIAAE